MTDIAPEQEIAVETEATETEVPVVAVTDEAPAKPKRKRRTKAEMEAWRAEQALKKATVTITDRVTASSIPVGTKVIIREAAYKFASMGEDKEGRTWRNKTATVKQTDYGDNRPGTAAESALGLLVTIGSGWDERQFAYLTKVDIVRGPENEEWFAGLEKEYRTLLLREHDLWKALHQNAVDRSYCPEYERWAKTVEGGEKWLKAGEKWNAEVEITVPYGRYVDAINDYLPRGIVIAGETVTVKGVLKPNSESRRVPDIDEDQVDKEGKETVAAALKRLVEAHGEEKTTWEILNFKQASVIKEFDKGNIIEKVAAAKRRWESVWISLVNKANDGDGYGDMPSLKRMYAQMVKDGHQMETFLIIDAEMEQNQPNGEGITTVDGRQFATVFWNHREGQGWPTQQQPKVKQRLTFKMNWSREKEPTEREIKDYLNKTARVNLTSLEVKKTWAFGLDLLSAGKPPKGFKFTGREWSSWREIPKGVDVHFFWTTPEDGRGSIYDGKTAVWKPNRDGYGGHVEIDGPDGDKYVVNGFKDYLWKEIEPTYETIGEKGVGPFRVGDRVMAYSIDGMPIVVPSEEGSRGTVVQTGSSPLIGFDEPTAYIVGGRISNSARHNRPDGTPYESIWYINESELALITETKPEEKAPAAVTLGEEYTNENLPPVGTMIEVTAYETIPAYVGAHGWFGTKTTGDENIGPHLWVKHRTDDRAVWLGTWTGRAINGTEDEKALVRTKVNPDATFNEIPTERYVATGQRWDRWDEIPDGTLIRVVSRNSRRAHEGDVGFWNTVRGVMTETLNGTSMHGLTLGDVVEEVLDTEGTATVNPF